MAVTPVIPDYITVHLGPPNSNARNVRVPFTDYIKNVASSEVYPSWPDSAIRANIYAQVSFALNRIFTEYYRSRGYNFDITNSTAYDQAYIDGRDIYSNISKIVDELFNDYVTKGNQIQPYFTEYCDGRNVTCRGLSQWGTVTLANRGRTPYQILQNYYGNDVNIVRNAPVKNIPESYPGRLLRLGSYGGEDIRTIQRQLNRIRQNYPSIPRIPDPNGFFDASTQAAVRQFQRIFNLTPDGIVGKATWYKIKQIYNAVKKLSELYSEGITISEVERIFSEVIRRGDRGRDVRTIQYYLNFLGFFNDRLPQISVDGIFGPATENAVRTFQREYGLTVDGIVGRATWNAILDAYDSTLNSLPDEYRSYSSLLYPGYTLTTGTSGNVVTQVQTFLRTIAQNNNAVPLITVDGVFGNRTREAVIAVQRLSGIEQTGVVGPLTWNAIVNLYNEYR
ncbi:MAG: peptidoglycan-binding protein [Clostridia bacterium]|nr:peptidoglycan-binding protein [Clostridia bacterium]